MSQKSPMIARNETKKGRKKREIAAVSEIASNTVKKSHCERQAANMSSTYEEIVRSLYVVGDDSVPRGGMVLKESTIRNAGIGLFTAHDIEAGEVITEYYGAYVPWKDCKQREKSHIRALFIMRTSIDGLFMADGETKITDPSVQLRGCGGAAFANDAKSSDANNAAYAVVHSEENALAIRRYFLVGNSEWSAHPSKSKIILVAKKRIEAGSEIFVSYGDDYWQKE